MKYRKRLLVVTDFHNCHFDWRGIKTDVRMRNMVEDICEEHEKDPLEMIIFLGDYSLDHWKWQIKGSYLAQGVSNTQNFMDKYKPDLPNVPMFWLAGNHEQYGEEKWKEITGNSRQGYTVIEDYLIIMWDSFGGELDPDYHHDGVYTPMNAEWVKGLMAEYPDKKVILCSHYFAADREKENASIVADDRVVMLFGGHNHASHVATLGEEFGGKKLAFAGNYGDAPDGHPWGYRELILTDESVESTYIIPENDMIVFDQPFKLEAKRKNTVSVNVK